MNDQQILKHRFDYTFAGPHLCISIAKGWMQIFARLCEDIDALLGEDKQEFS